ncbi:GNAT family N-acetyltransferase [Thalassotalea euphylliae]|uniref:GNAT family N-acetyltransferase n=1 Tax=Thalassotalea euphylliae TaxID=1655234 RepID=A0A3E0TY06_9GAMM|nr:GNAT family N-acetyltransferase [Thalassotalea euphylliae]REL29277.1 GNAT family N-acetyltransferase [Thalassotalea euphylliae]
MQENHISFSADANKNDVKRFYRNQNYSAKFKGYDQAFVASENSSAESPSYLHNNLSNNIIGSVIISQLRQGNKQALLHGLVVSQSYRGKGLGKKLTKHALKHCSLEVDHIICFAEPHLTQFYVSCGFSLVDKNSITANLSPELAARFTSYQKYQASLAIFISERR